MGDSDFDIPDEDGVSMTSPPKPSLASSRRTCSSRGSSVAGREARPNICIFQDCDADRKLGSRHCHLHHRHLDNMRTQISKAKGPAGLQAWIEKCKDDTFANSQVQYMASRNIGLSMFARAPPINWVEWQEEFGVQLSVTSTDRNEPFEEEQWIIRQVEKFGRGRDEMKQQWEMHLAGPSKRDYEGYKGALHLWLPKKQFQDKSQMMHINSQSVEKSKGKKKPQVAELDAFRKHAHEVDHHAGHDFFRGRSNLAGQEATGGRDPGGEDQSDSGGEYPGASSSAGPVPQQSPAKPLQKKSRSAGDSGMALDASDDDDSKTPQKKKRRTGNLAGSKASLFDSLSKQLQAKVALIQAKLDEAKKVQNEERSAEKPDSPTDVTTRRIYTAALTSCVEFSDTWLAVEEVQKQLEKADGQKSEADRGKWGITEDVLTQSPVLAAAIKSAGCNICIDRTDFLRSKRFIIEFTSSVIEVDVDEIGLEKKRLIWKRMWQALCQMETSLKKAALDVAKHMNGIASAKDKEKAKAKERESREAQAQHKAEMAARVRKAKGSSTIATNVLEFFKIPQQQFTPMRVGKTGVLAADADLTVPFIIEGSKDYDTWIANPAIAQVVTNYGSRHKKSQGFGLDGKTSQPLATKQGKEQTEQFFADFTAPIKKFVIDISEQSANWMSTSWIFGLAPGRHDQGVTPNSAAYLRVLLYGSVEVYTAPVRSLLDGFAKAGKPIASVAKLEEALLSMKEPDFTGLGVAVFFHKLVKDQIMHVPAGHLVLELRGGDSMIHGVRKSYFLQEKSAEVNHVPVQDLFEGEGRCVSRMGKTVDCMAAARIT